MDSYIGFCCFGAPYRYQFSGYGMSWCNLAGDNDHLIFIGEADSVNTVFACGGFSDADSGVTLTDSDVLSLRADYADSDCVLYIDFEDADGVKAVSDRSASGHTITPAGAFEIDREQKKFGTSGGSFTTNSDTLTIADHADFNFGSGDFTIEMWVKFSGASAAVGTFYKQTSDASNYIHFYHTDTPVDCVIFDVTVSGSPIVFLQATGLTWNPDQWYHLAVTREGNNWKMFRDGIVLDSAVAAVTISDFGSVVNINFSGYFSGWLDDYRVLKGRAEYTAAFTLPTYAHGMNYLKEYEIQTLAIADYGRESELSDVRSFLVDANGVLYLPTGNVPTNLAAAAVADGKIQLTWDYTTLNQPAEPDGFRIYRLIGATWTLDGTRAFSQRRGKQWISAVLTNDTEYSFRVCSYRTVAGIIYESDSTATATATADSEGPAAIDAFDFAEI